MTPSIDNTWYIFYSFIFVFNNLIKQPNTLLCASKVEEEKTLSRRYFYCHPSCRKVVVGPGDVKTVVAMEIKTNAINAFI